MTEDERTRRGVARLRRLMDRVDAEAAQGTRPEGMLGTSVIRAALQSEDALRKVLRSL